MCIRDRVNGDIVYVLSFAIIPGRVVGANAAEVLLVTRLQGTPGCYAQIKLATKASHEVGPSALLLAALQGVADGFGVREIAAVDAEKQSSYCEGFAVCFKSAYDDFFSKLAMDKTASGFYLSPVPIEMCIRDRSWWPLVQHLTSSAGELNKHPNGFGIPDSNGCIA